MKKILIVTETKNHLLMSVKEQLNKLSYQVEIAEAEANAINVHKDTARAIIVYADENLVEQGQALVFIKDMAVMNSLPVFVIGTDQELKSVYEAIPEILIIKSFKRPIDILVSTMAEQIDKLIVSATAKKKILAVDDSGAMLRMVKGWLDNKYQVFLASSGAMAIKYLALNKPDLVLLDYAMPVADGKQVLEMIRAETDFADIPVIFLTVVDDKERIMQVQGLNPDGYLLKSLEPSTIIKAVDDFFEKRKALL